MLRRATIIATQNPSITRNLSDIPQNLKAPINDGTGGVHHGESDLEHSDKDRHTIDENEKHSGKEAGKCSDCKNPSCKLSNVKIARKTKEEIKDPLEKPTRSLAGNSRDF